MKDYERLWEWGHESWERKETWADISHAAEMDRVIKFGLMLFSLF